MNENQLRYLAAAKPEVADALVKLAGAIEKLAVENPSAFNETVPSAQAQPQTNQANGVQVYGQAAPGQAAAAPEQAVAAAPVEQQQPEGAPQDIDPVMAAQQFMEPIFTAAQAGDEGAQATLAQAAAAIVRSVHSANTDNQAMVDEMTANSQAQPTDLSGVIDPAQQAQAQQYYDQQFGNTIAAPAQAAPAAAPAQQTVGTDPVPTGNASPEQAVADQIVPEQAAAKPKKKEEPPKKK